MRLVKKADGVIFADEKTEDAFNSLPEDDQLKKAIKKVIENLKENIFSGERIRKKLIPKEYIQKHCIDNLFWYKLTKDWRLVYSVAADNAEILALIIDYFDHKNYERKFRY